MIYIYLGDDTASSRNTFVEVKKSYQEKGFEIQNLDNSNISELSKWLDRAIGLFSEKKIFFGENLLSKKPNRDILKKYDEKATPSDFVIWEEKLDERNAKKYFKNAIIKNYKLPYNLFKLLDGIYPSNLRFVLQTLQKLELTVEENIILYMVEKRARELLLTKRGAEAGKALASWQISKLKAQAGRWEEPKLVSFYDALFRIEVLAKTGGSYYSIKKNLDILFCYYL